MSDYHDRRLKRKKRNPIFAFRYWRVWRRIEKTMPAYDEGFLDGLRMARAALPGDVDQPALRAIDSVIRNVDLVEPRRRVRRGEFQRGCLLCEDAMREEGCS